MNHQRTTSPWKKGRPRCYAKSATEQDVFQPISGFIGCSVWWVGDAECYLMTVRWLALSMQQVIWAYKLTFLSVLWLKRCNDHTVCTLHFYPCSQAQSSEEKDLDWVRWLVKNELTHKSAIGWGRDSQRTQEGWRREREEEAVFSPSGSLLPLRKCRSVSQSKITSSETLVEPIEPSSL